MELVKESACSTQGLGQEFPGVFSGAQRVTWEKMGMRSEAFLLPNQDPWLTGKASEGGRIYAKWTNGKHTLCYSQHPALHLLTTGRDEDLHRNAERSHSPLGDSSHTDGAGGIGGHHGQHGHAAIQPGFVGDDLTERGKEENPGAGEGRETCVFTENCPLGNLWSSFAFPAQRKWSTRLFMEKNGPVCKGRMGSGMELSGTSHSIRAFLALSASQQQQPEPEKRQGRICQGRERLW